MRTFALATEIRAYPGTVMTAVVLIAMVMHATWNALAKAMSDQVVAFGLIAVASIASGIVALTVVPFPSRASWGFLGASVLIHVGYNTALLNSYRFGDLGQTYPLARGVAPVLVAIGAFLGAGELPASRQWVALGVVCLGLVSLAHVGTGTRSDRRAVLLALLTGLAISAYTVVDGLGVRRSGDVLGYAATLFVVENCLMLIGLCAVRKRPLTRGADRTWLLGALAGFLQVGAYAMVLWAQTRVALVTVSALRETSVVVAAIIGTVFLHEGHGRRRILAAAIVACGVILLTVP